MRAKLGALEKRVSPLHTSLMEFAKQTPSLSDLRRLLSSLCILGLVGGLALAKRENSRKLSATLAFYQTYEDDGSSPSKSFSCLPKDVRADEVVSYGPKGTVAATVEKKLKDLNARCRRGKLVDAKGREIRFFRASCWGNPPPEYLEIHRREDEELAKLKKRYTVIEFGCNPMIQ